MLENFNDVFSLLAILASIVFVIYISIKLIFNSKNDDDDDFYREIM